MSGSNADPKRPRRADEAQQRLGNDMPVAVRPPTAHQIASCRAKLDAARAQLAGSKDAVADAAAAAASAADDRGALHAQIRELQRQLKSLDNVCAAKQATLLQAQARGVSYMRCSGLGGGGVRAKCTGILPEPPGWAGPGCWLGGGSGDGAPHRSADAEFCGGTCSTDGRQRRTAATPAVRSWRASCGRCA